MMALRAGWAGIRRYLGTAVETNGCMLKRGAKVAKEHRYYPQRVPREAQTIAAP